MNVKIEKTWKSRLEKEFEKDYFFRLTDFIKQECQKNTVFPQGHQIFHAFEQCPFEETRVVILGQDPYHEPGQAHGLCFSVQENVPNPPSLQNIFKEIRADMGYEPLPNGNLDRWASQGILLLTATLTVRAHQAGSHQNKGWETFTDAVIQTLASEKSKLVFLLWGAYAQKKGAFIDERKHLVLRSPHPSPLSAHRGFLGNKHFSQTNAYLTSNGFNPIDWR